MLGVSPYTDPAPTPGVPGRVAGTQGEGFDVMRSGDARVALIGFPSVGKSTLLSKVTSTESVAASYEFTTLTCIPGKIEVSVPALVPAGAVADV